MCRWIAKHSPWEMHATGKATLHWLHFYSTFTLLKPSDVFCLWANLWQGAWSNTEKIWRERWWTSCSDSRCCFTKRHSGNTNLSGKLLWHLTGSDSNTAGDSTNTDSTQRMLLWPDRRQLRCMCIHRRITKESKYVNVCVQDADCRCAKSLTSRELNDKCFPQTHSCIKKSTTHNIMYIFRMLHTSVCEFVSS